MRKTTKALVGIGVAVAIGGMALGGASLAHRNGGFGDHDDHRAVAMFDAVDADGDGTLTQVEIDTLRNDRHAAHDANGDGNLDLGEFAGLWHETTQPLTVRVFQMLDTDGDAVVSRAEYDRPLADIVERLDRDGDGGLSLQDRRHDDDDGWWWDDD